MQRVVINKCFGGWGISGELMIWLVENHPDCKYLTKHTKETHFGGEDGYWSKRELKHVEGKWFADGTFGGGPPIMTEDREEIWCEDFRYHWDHDDTKTEAEEEATQHDGRKAPELIAGIQEMGRREALKQDKNPDDLSEPELEALGCKRASGWAAELQIVDVPDGVLWEIDEYDGVESIHEAHRSWG